MNFFNIKILPQSMNHIEVSPGYINELVLSNQAIRAPNYRVDKKGNLRLGLREWGADLIPALMSIFWLKKDPRADKTDGWVGYSFHYGGEALRLEFDLKDDPKNNSYVLVFTAVEGKEVDPKSQKIEDRDFGTIKITKGKPTEKEWKKLIRQYQKSRKNYESDGEAAVKAFIDCLPSWQRAVVGTFDQLVEKEVPDVRRAIKWHAPFYGVPDNGWFAQINLLSKYVKITFLRGSELKPEPPIPINNKEARCVHIFEDENLNLDQLKNWIKQASSISGWLA